MYWQYKTADMIDNLDLLEGLNEQQKAAVVATEGYVCVIAGAGSGKTKTLAHRYAYLVNEVGVSPSNTMRYVYEQSCKRNEKPGTGISGYGQCK